MEIFIKEPKQQRSKDTVRAIQQSLIALVKERSVFDITTDDIAQGADVSIGSLYQFFGNRESIVLHLLEQILKDQAHYLTKAKSELQVVQAVMTDFNLVRAFAPVALQFKKPVYPRELLDHRKGKAIIEIICIAILNHNSWQELYDQLMRELVTGGMP